MAYRSISEIIGIINLSNPDQGIVCKITSSAHLIGREITNSLPTVSTDLRQPKDDLNKCIGKVFKLDLRA